MKIPLFDAHCDTAFKMALGEYGLYENPGHTDLKRGLEYAPYAQFFALFAVDGGKIPFGPHRFMDKTAEEIFDAELEFLLEEFKKNSARISLCTTVKEALDANAQGRAAAFLSIEGAELIGCDISRLREMHRLGVRAMNLTWNNPNALVCPSGLTELGRSFVSCCNELGIIIDVSHLPDEAFWEAIELSEDPVMASHSNSRAVCAHRRNLTDEQFLSVIRKRGVAGINLYAEFLGENPDMGTVIGHIEHFLSLGGEKSVALGCDFDGCDRLPEGIVGIEDLKNVYNALLRKNYPEALIRDIFYYNLKRVVEEVCDI